MEGLDEAEAGRALLPSPLIEANEEHTERGSGLSSGLEISPDADFPMRLAIDPSVLLFGEPGRCSLGSMRLRSSWFEAISCDFKGAVMLK